MEGKAGKAAAIEQPNIFKLRIGWIPAYGWKIRINAN